MNFAQMSRSERLRLSIQVSDLLSVCDFNVHPTAAGAPAERKFEHPFFETLAEWNQ